MVPSAVDNSRADDTRAGDVAEVRVPALVAPAEALRGAPQTARLVTELVGEFPAFRLIYKRDHRLSRAIDRALRVLTLGGQDRFLTEYHTVLGDTVYLPESWDRASDVARTIVLRHERVHLRQRRRYGNVGMAVLYLLPIFPLGLALGRARIEWEAYTETLRATAELEGLEAARDPRLRARIVARFTGPDYGWMWPFPRAVNRWYDQVLAELEASPRETGSSDRAASGRVRESSS